MPGRYRGQACDCCCGKAIGALSCTSTTIFGEAGELLVTPPDPPGNLAGITHADHDTVDFNSGYTREDIAFGGMSVTGTVTTGRVTDGGGNGTIETARLTMTANVTGDGTAGWIFWDDSFTPYRPRDHFDGYAWKHIGGKLRVRNALVEGQQYWDLDEDPQAKPVVMVGIAFEVDGERGYAFNNALTRQLRYNECWSGRSVSGLGQSGPQKPNAQNENYHLLDAAGMPIPGGTITEPCFPGKSTNQVEKLGYVILLSTWSGGMLSTWSSLGVPTGTHQEEFYIAGVGLNSCFQNFCHCYHSNIDKVFCFFDAGPGKIASTVTSRNPDQLQGQTVELNRAAGSNTYIGSYSSNSTAVTDEQIHTNAGGLGAADMVSFQYSDTGPFSTSHRADSPNSVWESALSDLSGLTVVVTGGPLYLNPIVTHISGVDMPNGFYARPSGVSTFRDKYGCAGNVASITIEVEIDPSHLSIAPDRAAYLQRRENRSCSKVTLKSGIWQQQWLQTSPPPFFIASHNPVLLQYESPKTLVNYSFPSTYIKWFNETPAAPTHFWEHFYRAGWDLNTSQHYPGWNLVIHE